MELGTGATGREQAMQGLVGDVGTTRENDRLQIRAAKNFLESVTGNDTNSSNEVSRDKTRETFNAKTVLNAMFHRDGDSNCS